MIEIANTLKTLEHHLSTHYSGIIICFSSLVYLRQIFNEGVYIYCMVGIHKSDNLQWPAALTPQYNSLYRDISRYSKCDLLRFITINCDILSQNIVKSVGNARHCLFALFHKSTYCVLCK